MVAIRSEQPITLPINQVIHGDCVEVLKTLPENSISAVITDPPYGLGEVRDIGKLLQAWVNGEDGREFNNTKGFMSKDWDVVPSPRVWKEAYRVLRPGGYLLAFAGTRTWDLMSISIRLAGFEDRDSINHSYGSQHLGWYYGSGFPKSTAIDRAIDKHLGKEQEREVVGRSNRHGGGTNDKYAQDEWTRNNAATMGMYITEPATEEAAKWQGWGNNLKPAWEPILMFRKPLEGTLAENVLKWGTGGLAIDQCRVGTHDYTQEQWNKKGEARTTGNAYGVHKGSITPLPQGRFPSNLLLSHSLFCTPLGTRKVKGSHSVGNPKPHQSKDGFNRGGLGTLSFDYVGEDGLEEVQAWDCDPSCPVYQLDLQSGIRKTHASGPKYTQAYLNGQTETFSSGVYGRNRSHGHPSEPSEGGASRYFTQFCYTAKASRAERNRGCEGLPEHAIDRYGECGQGSTPQQTPRVTRYEGNNHPTVKPQALLSWLSKLICPPGGIILDPFGGSGSQAVACINNGFHFILIEQEASYVEIARARVAQAWEVQP